MKHEGLRKANNILLFILGIMAILTIGSTFLIPFTFGIFLATLMTPFSDLLERKKINRGISSLISTLLIFVVVSVLSYLFFYQMSRFARDFPLIRYEFLRFIESIQHQISSITGLTLEEQNRIFQDRSVAMLATIEAYLTSFLGSILDTAVKFLLVLIYVFLLLLYRRKFTEFFMMYGSKEKEENKKIVLHKISKVVYQYLWGRVQVMAILGIMYYVTFLIFNIPYAILLTIFGALITIIPYIGPFISGLIPIIFAIFFGMDFYNVIIFSSLIATIQLIESYVLEPVIIGKEVELNPLAVIIAVIIGGMFWGIAGMVLFVPIFAMIKIISYHSINLQPIGYLLGTSGKFINKEQSETGV